MSDPAKFVIGALLLFLVCFIAMMRSLAVQEQKIDEFNAACYAAGGQPMHSQANRLVCAKEIK